MFIIVSNCTITVPGMETSKVKQCSFQNTQQIFVQIYNPFKVIVSIGLVLWNYSISIMQLLIWEDFINCGKSPIEYTISFQISQGGPRAYYYYVWNSYQFICNRVLKRHFRVMFYYLQYFQ